MALNPYGPLPIFPVHRVIDGICTCGRSCDSPGKHPIPEDGFKSATTDPDRIAEWLAQYPYANIGGCPFLVGITVIDIDGPEGVETWKQLMVEHGHVNSLTVHTGKGWHVYFHLDGGRTAKLGPQLETRGVGSYVLLPPSVHPNGFSYTWERPGPLADAPEFLRDMLSPKPVAPVGEFKPPPLNGVTRYGEAVLRGLAQEMRSTAVGGRNNTLVALAYRAARKHLAGEFDEQIAQDVLTGAALGAGLSEKETKRTLTSGWEAGLRSGPSERRRR